MIKRYFEIRVQVQHAMNKHCEKEKSKKKKKKIQGLFLSQDEKDKIKEVVDALKIVKKGSTILCGNGVTLAAADRVSPDYYFVYLFFPFIIYNLSKV